jgi:hypothetical protein
VVLLNAEIPITHLHPSQKMELIGARLYPPPSFTVLINTTGVPKYKIEGSTVLCI